MQVIWNKVALKFPLLSIAPLDRLKELLKKHWRDPRDKKDNPLYSTRKKARLMDSQPEEKLT